MRRSANLPLPLELKHRPRRLAALVRRPHPARAAHALCVLASGPVEDEVHAGVRRIGRPVPMEVFQKGHPVRRKLVDLEVPKWKRQRVVDAHDGGRVTGQFPGQPMGQIPATPVPARPGRWQNLLRRRLGCGAVDAQAFEP